jgi:hypothetical protein
MAPAWLPPRIHRLRSTGFISLMPCPKHCLSSGAALTHLGYAVRQSAEGLSSTYTRRGQRGPMRHHGIPVLARPVHTLHSAELAVLLLTPSECHEAYIDSRGPPLPTEPEHLGTSSGACPWALKSVMRQSNARLLSQTR